jgi:multicomponent Na+:H+ antiporter subunit E
VFIILYLLWFVLNGKFELTSAFLEIALFGLFVTSLVYFFLCKFTDFSFEKDKKFCRNFFLFIYYLMVLLKEIFMSNFNVVKTILRKGDNSSPEIVRINLGIKSKFVNTLIANSITLTPGTITISLTENEIVVHALRHEYLDGIDNSKLLKILMKMEGYLQWM